MAWVEIIRHACGSRPTIFSPDTGRRSVPALRSTLERWNDQGLTIYFQLPRTYECARVLGLFFDWMQERQVDVADVDALVADTEQD